MADSWWRYSLRAAAVGGGLTALWIVFAAVASVSVCQNSWTCAVVLIRGYWVIPVLGALMAWPVARWAGLRPAWLVALIGGVVGMAGLWVGDSLGLAPTLTSPWLVLIVAAAFVVAAWVVVPRSPLAWRALLLVAALLPLPVVELTAGIRLSSARQNELAKAGVPLLGPDVPAGYQIRNAGAIAYDEHEFFYRVEPTSLGAHPDPAAEDKASIEILVAPLAPGFAPPNHCTFLRTGDVGDRVPSCPSVGPDTWRWASRDGSYVSYFVRRGDVGVEVERHSGQVPEAMLEGIARTLAPRDPSYFTES